MVKYELLLKENLLTLSCEQVVLVLVELLLDFPAEHIFYFIYILIIKKLI